MKHGFNLLVQIDSFLSDNFPDCRNSYQVKKRYGKFSSSVYRQLSNVVNNLRSGVLDVEAQTFSVLMESSDDIFNEELSESKCDNCIYCDFESGYPCCTLRGNPNDYPDSKCCLSHEVTK